MCRQTLLLGPEHPRRGQKALDGGPAGGQSQHHSELWNQPTKPVSLLLRQEVSAEGILGPNLIPSLGQWVPKAQVGVTVWKLDLHSSCSTGPHLGARLRRRKLGEALPVSGCTLGLSGGTQTSQWKE